MLVICRSNGEPVFENYVPSKSKATRGTNYRNTKLAVLVIVETSSCVCNHRIIDYQQRQSRIDKHVLKVNYSPHMFNTIFLTKTLNKKR